ncbi:XdhC family protein [Defluviimonas sp. SAOS-178_SWC]|uniref:XdhC family protein n=1 Tax=Defluviimonas sp. SAOS-178_SWC TaxID=3121287 RepID=UPI003221CBFE
MHESQLSRGLTADPIDALLADTREGVLAVIVGVEGPSYRPLGAVMTVFADAQRVGSLSSGCIERDIALHAVEALAGGRPRSIRYGRGSPFIDIRLPCGGGLDILLVPRPDREILGQLADRRNARLPVTLAIDTESGALALAEDTQTGAAGAMFNIRFLPEIKFLIFGKGPEAGTFAALVRAAGFPSILLSPDTETLDHGAQAGCETRHLHRPGFPADLAVDPRTAIVLFFHDHDWEPPILAEALSRPAFYIGAQGSMKAREVRMLELAALGLDDETLARVRGPIGLLPSARDARTLAISVLAEALDIANRAASQGRDRQSEPAVSPNTGPNH